MGNPGITKPTTIEAFMKAHTELRVGADAIACLIDRLTALAEVIAKAAETNAKKENRTTIWAADVSYGSAGNRGKGGSEVEGKGRDERRREGRRGGRPLGQRSGK